MVNPVFVNELRQSIFRRKPVLGITLWGLTTGFLMWLTQFTGLTSNPLSWLPSFILPILVPPFSAGLFAREYEQQTWQDLYLTRLTNVQIVTGKFCAALVSVSALVISFIPALMLMMAYQSLSVEQGITITNSSYHNVTSGDYAAWNIFPGLWTIVLIIKLILSTCLYVLVGMVCSRYCSTRRMALACSYVAVFLYALMGYALWQAVGQEADANGVLLSNSYGESNSSVALFEPGFMQGIHLIFCSVVGCGALVLLWVSLSEQRGYKDNTAGGVVNRAWQPIAKKKA